MMPQVQKELSLSPAVTKKVTDRYMALMKEFQGVASTSSAKNQQANMQAIVKKSQQAQKEILGMLTPAQKTRLRQITIQQMGAGALAHPEMKKELGLSDEQARRITAIVKDGTTQMIKSMTTVKPSADRGQALRQAGEFAKKQEEWKSKMLKESLKGLNATQLAKWKAAQGKPFKLDMMGAMRSMGARTGGG
jgi:hypothetical protein